MNCISVNFKTAPDSVRDKIFFSAEQRESLISEAEFSLFVPLFTCNRTEFYFDGETEKAVALFEKYCPVEDIKRYVNVFVGDGALKHLFSVCGGMDSMLVGEDEILGQVRGAYLFARERGKLNSEGEMYFQAALAAGKAVRTDTLISKTALSYPTIAAHIISSDKAEKKCALVIGATGKIGSDVVKDLLSLGVTVYATVRTHGKAALLPEGALPVDYDERYSAMKNCGYIVSASSSPHFTVTAGALKLNGVSGKVIIDMASPSDVDRAAAEENTLVTLSDLADISARNGEIKESERVRAEEIIYSHYGKLKKNLAYRSIVPLLPLLKEKFGSDARERLLKAKAEFSAEEFCSFVRVALSAFEDKGE